jgi:hypothetical protein
MVWLAAEGRMLEQVFMDPCKQRTASQLDQQPATFERSEVYIFSYERIVSEYTVGYEVQLAADSSL